MIIEAYISDDDDAGGGEGWEGGESISNLA